MDHGIQQETSGLCSIEQELGDFVVVRRRRSSSSTFDSDDSDGGGSSRHSGSIGRVKRTRTVSSSSSSSHSSGSDAEFIITPATTVGGLNNVKNHTQSSDDDDARSDEEEELELEKELVYDLQHFTDYPKEDERQKYRFEKLFVDNFRNVPCRRTIIHDVYERNTTHGECREILRGLHVPFRGAIFIIAAHNNHYHIVHDCAYTSSHCRCARINQFRGLIKQRRFRRRTIRSIDFSTKHWVNLTKYFQSDGRRMYHFEIAGRVWIQCRQDGRLQVQRSLQCGEEELVETRDVQDDFPDFLGCGSEGNSDSQTNQPGLQTNEGDARSEKGSKGDRILKLLRQFPTAPIGHVFNTTLWANSKYKWLPRSNTLLQKCVEYIGLEYCEKNVEEFYQIYQKIDPKNLIFNAPFGNIESYYYDLKTSIYVLEELLLFQFHDDKQKVKDFLKMLLNVLDKKILKLNTLFVLSPPNAGKNFFFDAVLHYFLNFGQMGNFNKYTSFPLMECVNRRIILWNEPVCEPSAFETLKTIFGGDTTNVKVKYAGDAIIGRTPIIILSNNDIFPKDAAFRSRMVRYVWRSCDALKNVKKKPWPIAIYHLFKKYNII